ncbi:MAG TPA: hypothetical protein VFT47_13680 [Vicinamibacterales bacterium]|nr:hypothetical protein [Vicinamibacterales bacterium]
MNGRIHIQFSVAAVAGAVVMTVGSLSANHSWGSYHWARTANPFTLAVGDNVSSAWDSYLNTAISDWSASTVLNLAKVAGGTRPRQCKATSGRIEVCNDAYGNNGWLGIARISVSGTHITAATTRVNDSYFNTATYNTPAWRRLVMCQEVGHDFGLDHQDETFNNPNLGTCMDYTSDPDGGGFYGPTNEHPNKHDYDQLDTIYRHLDGTSTVGSFGVVASPQDKENEPENWGQLVRRSRNGRVEIYELDLGKGRRIFTHVFWADPEGDSRAER